MIDLKRTKENKWIFQKNISSAEIMNKFINLTSQMGNNAHKRAMLEELKSSGYYHGRSAVGSTNTMGVRTSQMKFYMFGYSLPSSRKNAFFLSPSSASMLKENTKENIAKMSLVNLFSIQFPHPFSKTPKNFKIHAGRLIIKLLLDERINCKLYIDEACYFLPFIESINEEKYEDLISSVLEFRKLNFFEKEKLLRSVDKSDDIFSNVFHEFNYYFLRIFHGLKVFKLVEDDFYNDGNLHCFKHGNGHTFRSDAIFSRKKYSGYFKLEDNILHAARLLNDKFSCFDNVETLADNNVFSKEDFILDLYQNKQLSYISLICPSLSRNEEISNVIFNMVKMSKYGSKDGNDFEKSLKPVFEFFRQTANVEPIGGSGDTDLLCTMKADDGFLYKVNIDAKTSHKSTSSLNPARLTKHLRMHNSKYCVVVSSRFASGVKDDIDGYDIVAITAETLAKYCLNEYNISNDGCIDYQMLESIFLRNMGKNVTPYVESFIENYYGA